MNARISLETQLRIRLEGPQTFEEAVFLKQRLCQLFQHCLYANTMPELTRYMDEFQVLFRWLPMANNRFYEETQRLAELPPVILHMTPHEYIGLPEPEPK